MPERQSPEHLSDEALFDRVQEHTFLWFWERAEPTSGMAPDRTTAPANVVTIGGTGFAVMVMILGVERGYITRRQALDRVRLIVRTLERVDRHHGAYPHWLYVDSGKSFAFSEKDDGGDLVETAFLVQGLLAARHYFDGAEGDERDLRARIDAIWHGIDWAWYKAPDDEVLLWHWSPKWDFAMNHSIRGWNECLITYVLAAASPTHPIDPALYHNGWVRSPEFTNGEKTFGVELPLGPPLGGPLFFAHYSFLGLDPRGLKDRYADYFEQNCRHVAINRAYCIDNPNGYKGYGPNCWGLTASDSVDGYVGHSPTRDRGVITPTAALASFPYAPEAAMAAMRHFHDDLGDRIWTNWGFTDAFSEQFDWYSADHLAIDQGPIAIMMENHRSGLLWRLFMQAPEVHEGLARLGFDAPAVA